MKKKVEKEVVVNCYPPQTNKKTVMGSNGEIPVTPVTPIPETLPSNTFSGDGLKNQPVTTRHTRHQSALKVGDQVEYVGTKVSLQNQYNGVLIVYEVGNDLYTCMKPDKRLTAWIEVTDLRLVGDRVAS